LQAAERALLQQVPHVEAVRRRVEAGVDGQRAGGAGVGGIEARQQLVGGDLVDQPAEAQVLGEGGGLHDLLHTTGRAIR
jgi:hypothetical protein